MFIKLVSVFTFRTTQNHDDVRDSRPQHVAVNKWIYKYSRRCVVRKMKTDILCLFVYTHRHAVLKSQQNYRQSYCKNYKLFPYFSLIIRSIERCFKQKLVRPNTICIFFFFCAILVTESRGFTSTTTEYHTSSTSVDLFRRLNIRTDRRDLPIMRTCHAFTSWEVHMKWDQPSHARPELGHAKSIHGYSQ